MKSFGTKIMNARSFSNFYELESRIMLEGDLTGQNVDMSDIAPAPSNTVENKTDTNTPKALSPVKASNNNTPHTTPIHNTTGLQINTHYASGVSVKTFVSDDVKIVDSNEDASSISFSTENTDQTVVSLSSIFEDANSFVRNNYADDLESFGEDLRRSYEIIEERIVEAKEETTQFIEETKEKVEEIAANIKDDIVGFFNKFKHFFYNSQDNEDLIADKNKENENKYNQDKFGLNDINFLQKAENNKGALEALINNNNQELAENTPQKSEVEWVVQNTSSTDEAELETTDNASTPEKQSAKQYITYPKDIDVENIFNDGNTVYKTDTQRKSIKASDIILASTVTIFTPNLGEKYTQSLLNQFNKKNGDKNNSSDVTIRRDDMSSLYLLPNIMKKKDTNTSSGLHNQLFKEAEKHSLERQKLQEAF